MFRNLLPAVIFLGVASIPLATHATTPFELKSVNVDLPDSDRMFSAGMVLNQPSLSKQAWAVEVNKMINNYKAPVAPEDVGAIVEYLSALKGTK